ncbi:hypothetical protein DW080_22245, partial [Bacteroides caccae]
NNKELPMTEKMFTGIEFERCKSKQIILFFFLQLYIGFASHLVLIIVFNIFGKDHWCAFER